MTTSQDFSPQVTVPQPVLPHQPQPPALFAGLPLQNFAAFSLVMEWLIILDHASPELNASMAQAIAMQSLRI